MTNRSAASIKQGFLALRDQLAQVLGLQTVDMLIDRSVTEIRAAYPLVQGITLEDGALSFASLDLAFSEASSEDAQAAVNAMTAVMLLILARLLGKRVAQSLAEQVHREDLLEPIRL